MSKASKIVLIIFIVIDLCYVGFFVIAGANPFMFTSEKEIYQMGVDELSIGIKDEVNKRGHIEKAIKYFEMAKKRGYNERDLYVRLHESYQQLGDRNKEEEVLTKALELFPKDKEFLLYRGLSRLQQKKYPLAQTDFNQIITIDTTSKDTSEYLDDAFYNKGAITYKQGDTTKAAIDFKIAQGLTTDTLKKYDVYLKTLK